MNKTKILIIALLTLNASWAGAEQYPRPLGSDQRVKHVRYNENEVYEIQATYGFQTTIEFADQEAVQVASIGDSIAWQVMPVGNRLFLKPVEENPRTNLTVVTNKRSYYFALSTTNANTKAATYLVRFEYPEEIRNLKAQEITKVASPANYNFNYELKKAKKSGLIQAFDDNEFTYLQFKSLSDLPAIFLLDENKKESLVNYRIDGPYVVIERIAENLVFRRGKIVGYLSNKSKKLNSSSEKSNG